MGNDLHMIAWNLSQQFPVSNPLTFVSVALLALQILQFIGTSLSLQSNGENKGNICHFIH